MAQSFLFYDLETFGLDSRADRIAQAALVRTDMELRVIDDPIVLLCRIAPDYLPSPSSCLVTGITPQQTLKDGICEADFIKRINEEFSRPGTTTLGFNSISFDDEFIRNCLYRNLMDPYEREWMNGCSRWDILDLVRAVHDFRPEGIAFNHRTEKGNPSFKLVHLTEDNGIEQEGAHDALVDVYATINVAKLIRDRQPKLFNYYLTHRSKMAANSLIDTMGLKPLMYTCQAFTDERGASRPIVPIAYDRKKSSSVACFDLTKEASTLLSDEPEGLVWVTTNKCPYLAPISVLTKDEAVQRRLGTDLALMERNLDFIKANRAEISRRITARMEETEARRSEVPSDPDLRIYTDSFYSDSDRVNMKLVQSLPPERRLHSPWHFDSDKVPKLLFRQVARNWPEVLNENEAIMWKNYCATRLLQPFNRNPDYNSYMKEIADKLDSMGTSGRDKLVLVALREYGQSLYESLMS